MSAAFTMECSELSERSFHVCVSSCMRSANEVGTKFTLYTLGKISVSDAGAVRSSYANHQFRLYARSNEPAPNFAFRIRIPRISSPPANLISPSNLP